MGLSGMLTQRLRLLLPGRVDTPTGGWTDAFTDGPELRGRIVAASQPIERVVSGEAHVTELADVTVEDHASLTAACRIRDERDVVWELVGLTRQDGFAFATGRRV